MLHLAGRLKAWAHMALSIRESCLVRRGQPLERAQLMAEVLVAAA